MKLHRSISIFFVAEAKVAGYTPICFIVLAIAAITSRPRCDTFPAAFGPPELFFQLGLE
jgi:hypothetical protein